MAEEYNRAPLLARDFELFTFAVAYNVTNLKLTYKLERSVYYSKQTLFQNCDNLILRHTVNFMYYVHFTMYYTP